MKKQKSRKKKRRNKSGKESVYVPNFISLKTRVYLLLGVIFLMTYGLVSYFKDSLYVPVRRGRGFYLEGDAVSIMVVAIIFACVGLLSVIIDHYDKRNNEHKYEKFLSFSMYGAVISAVGAIVVNVARHLNA